MTQIARNLKLYFWSEFFGSISFITPVITLFYLHRGLEYSDLFIMLLIWVITTLLMEVPTGTFADKYGPKKSFIVGHSIKIFSIAILIFAFNKWLFYISAGLSALSFTFFSGSDQAFIYESLKELKRENEMSRVWGRIHSAAIFPSAITILIGAYVAKDLAEDQFVLIISLGLLFNLIKFVLLVFLVPPKSFDHQEDKHSFDFVKSGFKNILSQKDLVLLFVNESLVMIPTYVVIANENLIQPYFVASGIPIIFIGVIYSIDALASSFMLNSVKLAEKLFTRKTITYITGVMIGVAFFLGALLDESVVLALFVFFTVKIFFWLRYPLFQQIKNDYIPSNSRATTLSLLSMVDSGFDVVILGTLGIISDMGIQTVFLVCGIIVTFGLLFPVRVRIESKKNK